MNIHCTGQRNQKSIIQNSKFIASETKSFNIRNVVISIIDKSFIKGRKISRFLQEKISRDRRGGKEKHTALGCGSGNS